MYYILIKDNQVIVYSTRFVFKKKSFLFQCSLLSDADLMMGFVVVLFLSTEISPQSVTLLTSFLFILANKTAALSLQS